MEQEAADAMLEGMAVELLPYYCPPFTLPRTPRPFIRRQPCEPENCKFLGAFGR
jgi:hypothetical protein